MGMKAGDTGPSPSRSGLDAQRFGWRKNGFKGGGEFFFRVRRVRRGLAPGLLKVQGAAGLRISDKLFYDNNLRGYGEVPRCRRSVARNRSRCVWRPARARRAPLATVARPVLSGPGCSGIGTDRVRRCRSMNGANATLPRNEMARPLQIRHAIRESPTAPGSKPQFAQNVSAEAFR